MTDDDRCAFDVELDDDGDPLPTPWQRFVDEVKDTKRAASAAVDAVAYGDPRALRSMARSLLDSDDNAWCYFFQELIARKPPITRVIRTEFLDFWARWGMTIRGQTWDDGLLVDGMRLIVGQYRGPDRRLYRGERVGAYTDGKVGIAWTNRYQIAQWFAYWHRGVILETLAPARAILGSVASWTTVDGERDPIGEYLVDPRLLVNINRVDLHYVIRHQAAQ